MFSLTNPFCVGIEWPFFLRASLHYSQTLGKFVGKNFPANAASGKIHFEAGAFSVL
jgi:hypothetical protein